MTKNADSQIQKIFFDRLARLDAEYEEISFPLADYAVAAYYILATAEASSNLARYTGMRYGAQEEVSGSFSEHFARIRSKYFGSEEKRRIILGTFVRTAGYKDKYYAKALKIREKIQDEFEALFNSYDALVSPSMPIIAPRFEEITNLKPIEVYALDQCTIPPNLAGLPHLSIPIGKVQNMPVGLQLITHRWEEETLFAFGKEIEATL